MLICQKNEDENCPIRLRISNNDLSVIDNKSNLMSFTELDKKQNEMNDSVLLKNEYQHLITTNNKEMSISFTNVFDLSLFQSIKNHFLSIFKITYPDEFFDDIYHNKYHSIIGLEKDSREVICFAHLDIDKIEKSGKILTVCVVKEHQGQKIGTKLMKKVLEELLVLGVKEVSLHVQVVNFAAVKLYSNCGFDVRKKIPNYYGLKYDVESSDAFLMTKTMLKDLYHIKKNWFENLIHSISSCFSF